MVRIVLGWLTVERRTTGFGGEPVRVEHDEKIALLVQALINYFTRHPGAADSVEGIHQWWLERQGIQCSLHQVQEALEILYKKKTVAKTVNQSGSIIYSSLHKNTMH